MSSDVTGRTPVAARRSWLFVPGADRAALEAAPTSGADVLIQELEDFTIPEMRPAAREMSGDIVAGWKATGVVSAVRVNPLDGDGRADLAAVMPGAPDAILLPKVSRPEQVAALDEAIRRLEQIHRIEPGHTELVPNIESAEGLMQTYDIARATPHVSACGVASEDMAADLGAERGMDATELAYVRARFHVECVAAGVLSIDCPYTWNDIDGVEAEARHARRLGYTAKSAVLPEHCATINMIFTPGADEVAEARRIVETFDAARESGAGVVEMDGNRIEMPTYLNAQRLLARADLFGVAGK